MSTKPTRRRVQIRHHPETAAVMEGFDPNLSVMAARPPIYPVSTYCFHSASEAKRFFEIALGKEEVADQSTGLIYARLNNPNAEMFEAQLTSLEKGGAVESASFASGMSAITSTFLAFLRPGDAVLHTCPIYGGTDHVLNHILPGFGIASACVDAGDTEGLAREAEKLGERLAIIYVETPANPTLTMTDIRAAVEIARAHKRSRGRVLTMVDNTFLGPMFQSPLKQGADLVVYSATKYLGGHSDVVAGAVVAKDADLLREVKTIRSFLGTICEPFSAWLLQRSLATIYTRVVKQSKNAARLVERFKDHPKLEGMRYPTLLDGEQQRVFKAQCSGPGAMLAFDVKGGEAAAFRFLDALKLARLAVSLGSVESLVTHPKTTTSSEMDPEEMARTGITDGMIRFSVGVEYWRDLAEDIEQALEQV